jgi:hypothetical protein
MELMEINSAINPQRLLIGIAGISIGIISALPFGGLAFVPGCMFGLAVAIIYYININDAEKYTALRLFIAGGITVMGLLCYEVAFWITIFLTTAHSQDISLIAAPAGAAIGGFIATWLFITYLQIVTKKYAAVRNKFSLYGSLLGALLIDSIAYVISVAESPDTSVIFIYNCVFFIGWQTIMLLIVSGPLLKKADNQITNPTAVAGPVNDSAPR